MNVPSKLNSYVSIILKDYSNLISLNVHALVVDPGPKSTSLYPLSKVYPWIVHFVIKRVPVIVPEYLTNVYFSDFVLALKRSVVKSISFIVPPMSKTTPNPAES